MRRLNELTIEMIKYYEGDAKRIQHFIKVHSFAALIGRTEGIDERTQYILEAAALTHDIGIRPAEEKYGSSAGKYQETEGPAPAREMLRGLGFDDELTERVCFLIAHHHTYTDIEGIDYQILVEADFLVNLFEDNAPASSVRYAGEKIFHTDTGRSLLRTMFGAV